VPRPTSEMLTEREAQIMDVLWRLSSATAEQVREQLPGEPHDSTVRTLLRVLEGKGFVEHEARGKTFVYRAAARRENVQRTALRSFISRLFGGSAEDLVLRLLEDEQITPEQLAELRAAGRKASAGAPKRKRKGDRR
jgi:BlaI family penicillinase repressor